MVRHAVKQFRHMKEIKPEHKVALPTDKKRRLMPQAANMASGASSINSQHRPLTDSQAIAMSDMLLSSQEAEQYWQESGEGEHIEPTYQNQTNIEANMDQAEADADKHLLSWEIRDQSVDQYRYYKRDWQAWTDELARGAEEVSRIALYKELYVTPRNEDVQAVAQKWPYLI